MVDHQLIARLENVQRRAWRRGRGRRSRGNSGMRESVMIAYAYIYITPGRAARKSNATAPGPLAFRRARACLRLFARREYHRIRACAPVPAGRCAKDAGQIENSLPRISDSLREASGNEWWRRRCRRASCIPARGRSARTRQSGFSATNCSRTSRRDFCVWVMALKARIIAGLRARAKRAAFSFDDTRMSAE